MMRIIGLLVIVAMTFTVGIWWGMRLGKRVGYSICVSEEDDDTVRTHKF
jgi:hypothetical protein